MLSHRKGSRPGPKARMTLVGPALAIVITACGPSGPATRGELCEAYRSYESTASAWHPFSNSGVFRALRNLGDVASRYQDSGSVRAAGPELKRLGSGQSFSIMEVEFTAAPIAAECRLGTAP